MDIRSYARVTRHKAQVVLAVGLGVAVSAAAWQFAAPPSDEATASPSDGQSTQLLPLTPDQCGIARSMVGNTLANARAAGAAPIVLQQLELQVESARAWVAAGCPADAARGFIPDSDGKGGQIRLLSEQSFAAGPEGNLGRVVIESR